jgi:hypothetical protein
MSAKRKSLYVKSRQAGSTHPVMGYCVIRGK